MGVDADTVAQEFAGVWEILLSSTPGWWGERRDGIVGGITLAQLPTLNGVWAYSAAADVEAIDELMARVADTGLPYCLQAADEVDAAPEVAARRGMQPVDAVPLMVLEHPDAVPDVEVPGLRVRELAPEDHRVHASLAAAGFEVEEEHFHRLVTPELARVQGLRSYLGEVDGQAVSTGAGFTRGKWVGVFNIATPPSHRRRGYGAAVTMRAVRDGTRHGARRAWLQASPAGRPVYEQLGFETVAWWRCWVAAGA